MLKNFVLPAIMPNRKILAIDIGGTLAKIAYYLPKDDPIRHKPYIFEQLTQTAIPSKLPSPLTIESVELANGDEIFLRSFPSNKIEEFLDFVNQNNLVDNNTHIHATGGGSYKY